MLVCVAELVVGGTCCNADVDAFGDGITSSSCESGLMTPSSFRRAEKLGKLGMRYRIANAKLEREEDTPKLVCCFLFTYSQLVKNSP